MRIRGIVCIGILAFSIDGFSEIRLTAGAVGGLFILPEEVRGNVLEYGYSTRLAGNPFIESATTDVSGGYTRQQYRYSHQIHPDLLPNVGFRIGAEFFFNRNLGLGIDFCSGYSVDEKSAASTDRDTLPESYYSVIPSDFRVREVMASQNQYLRYRTGGLALLYRAPINAQWTAHVGMGIGTSRYRLLIKKDEYSVKISHYQSNGHVVYTENLLPHFEVLGIDYLAPYVRPSAGIEYALSREFSIKTDAALPLSYIERGYYWSDQSGMDKDVVFYPHKRFSAGNLQLAISALLSVGKASSK